MAKDLSLVHQRLLHHNGAFGHNAALRAVYGVTRQSLHAAQGQLTIVPVSPSL